MSETQRTIGEWIDATFPGTDPESPRKSIRALEEMVELCLASGASVAEIDHAVTNAIEAEAYRRMTLEEISERGWHSLPGRREPDKILAEAADVLIVLYGLAHMRGFDLHAEVDRKMAVNRSRRWKANGDGTGYHIRDEVPGGGA